jgi:hypothetical protein
MNVIASVEVFFLAEYLAVGVAGLPAFHLRQKAVREASADVFHGFGQVVGCHEKVDVIWHDDEGVELVEALHAVDLERFEHQLRGGFDLKEAAAIERDRGEEEGAGLGLSPRSRHAGSLVALQGFVARQRRAILSFRFAPLLPAAARKRALRGYLTAELKFGPAGRFVASSGMALL